MKSVYNFVVTPKGERYNNKKKVGDSELILNTEIYNHQFVNRIAKVISTPIIGDTDIKPGDNVIVHHNVFRRWHNQYGTTGKVYKKRSDAVRQGRAIEISKRNKRKK